LVRRNHASAVHASRRRNDAIGGIALHGPVEVDGQRCDVGGVRFDLNC